LTRHVSLPHIGDMKHESDEFLRFEQTAPHKWYVFDRRFRLSFGPFRTKKAARAFCLSVNPD
jgi:hypothetical protein